MTGYDHMKADGRFVPKRCRQEVPPSPDTEMRDNYRWPELKPELLHKRHSTDPRVSFCGIGTDLKKSSTVLAIHQA